MRHVPYRGKQIILDIAAGLLTLHDQSIAHLDIKSPNVLLTSERRGKIADFGLGKMLNGVAANTLSQIGTPAWTCPALLLHGRYSAKSDIWSLSTIMIEASTSLISDVVACSVRRLGIRACLRAVPSKFLTLAIAPACDCGSAVVQQQSQGQGGAHSLWEK